MQGFVPIYYEIKDKDVKIPRYAHEGDSGMDICSNEDIHIKPQQTVLISTGLFVEIPFGYEIQIRPRSGLSLKTPLRISNSPATIDSGYRGEIGIIVTNTSLPSEVYNGIYDLTEKDNRHGIYKINKYDRLAQIVLIEINLMFWKKGSITKTERNEKGFGSTGTGV